MSVIALLLATVGASLTTGAGFLVWQRRPRRGYYRDPAYITCDTPAPDGSLTCAQQAGHFGWHSADGTSWWDDTWDCDHWADTVADLPPGHPSAPFQVISPTGTIPAMPPAPRPKPAPPRTASGLGPGYAAGRLIIPGNIHLPLEDRVALARTTLTPRQQKQVDAYMAAYYKRVADNARITAANRRTQQWKTAQDLIMFGVVALVSWLWIMSHFM